MKKIFTWGLFGISSLPVLIIAALLLAPFFVDVQQYKPQIENRVSEITGRPFTLEGDIHFTLFPWAKISLSDIRLGNPAGFETTNFLSVKSLEVDVELLPLLSKNIRIKRFSLKNPIITLTRNTKGMGNWEMLARPEKEDRIQGKKQQEPSDEGGKEFSIDSLAVKTFTLSEGVLLWIDRIKGKPREIRNLALELTDLSLVRPVQIECSATVDQQPVSVHGTIGPIGKNQGKGTVPVDISVGFFKEIEMDIKGEFNDPADMKNFDLQLQIQPFSPRKVFGSMNKPFPLKTADAQALNKVALVCRASKNSSRLSLSDGSLSLDETTLKFSAALKDFTKPEMTFDLIMDRLDMDRYLFPKAEQQKRQDTPKNEKKNPSVSGGKPDYMLRSLTLIGNVFIKELKIKEAKIQDFYLKLMGKNGLFQIQPFAMKLYGGEMSGAGSLNLAQDVLRTQIQLKAGGVRAGPMIRDILKRDIMEGDFAMDLKIKATGNNNAAIKKSLHGKGTLQFADGAINGIDLSGMLQNSRAALELSEGSDGIPHTRFSEFAIPFTISDGVMTTTDTTLTSTLLNIQVEGQANIVDETLDFRIEPRFMAPAKGRKDEENQKGVTIPVLVGGTFSSPRFLPDLDFILKQTFGKEIKGLSELQKALLKSKEDDGKKSRGNKILDFLNKLR